MKFLRELLRFIFTFSLIFLVSFTLMNFSGVKSMLALYFNQEQIEESHENSVVKDVDDKVLIPAHAKKLAKKEHPPLNLQPSPIDYRLIIPKLGINVPLVEMDDRYISDDLWGEFEKEVQSALREGVVHYPGTAMPGQFGNVFFTGHSSYYPWDSGSYKDVFANLVQLEVGDHYYVYYKQQKYKYRVSEKKEVYPTEVGVLEQPRNKKMSTLMTCWPLGTVLRRYIVIANQV